MKLLFSLLLPLFFLTGKVAYRDICDRKHMVIAIPCAEELLAVVTTPTATTKNRANTSEILPDEEFCTKSRELWIYISIASAGFITILALLYHITNRKALRHKITLIDKFMENEIGNISSETYMRVNDRKKYNDDTHHNFASAIAVAANFLRYKELETADSDEQKLFNSITKLLQESYERARAKSDNMHLVQSGIFLRNIDQIIDLLFTGTNILVKKTIDNTGFVNVEGDTKIILLLFLKEASINIIQQLHSGTVHILLFHDSNYVFTTIESIGKKRLLPLKNNSIELHAVLENIHIAGGEATVHAQSKTGITYKMSVPVRY